MAVPLEIKKAGKKKQRLDELCVAAYPHLSRNLLQSWIMQGKVTVDGRVVTKAGTPVASTAVISLEAEEPKYVCRG
ncbi:uncharacterized protein LOC109003672 isoform X1, partial [Haematococcus lacustris]